MRRLINRYDITDGIDQSVRKAIEDAINNNSIKTLIELEHFVRKTIGASVNNRSQKFFQQYIFFFVIIYQLVQKKAKSSPSYAELWEHCQKLIPMHQKEIILYDIGHAQNARNNIKEQEEINKFYYWAFYAFSQLFNQIVQNNDLKMFENTVNEYDQISNGLFSFQHELRREIDRLKWDDVPDENQGLSDKQEKLKTLETFDDLKRQTLAGIKYWIYLLYSQNIITKENVLIYIDRLNILGSSDELLHDLLFFRSGKAYSYLGWDTWDYKERPNGQVFTPISTYEWLTMGFLIDRIKGDLLYINMQEISQEELKVAEFLVNSIKEYCEYFQKNFLKWKEILNVSTPEELKEKCDKMIELFSMLKRKNIQQKEKDIASAELDQELVLRFKESVGESWREEARIHALFKHYGNCKIIDDTERILKSVGWKTLFEKAKMMFVTASYEPIHGVSRMGGEMGRWEDTAFFMSILKSEYNKVSGKGVIKVIDNGISKLLENNQKPNMILISPGYSYIEDELLKDKRYIQKRYDQVDNELARFYLGTFADIPIYTSFSDLLKNKVLVCNFQEAFVMEYRTNETWFANEFRINVREVTDEEANQKLKENPEKWKKTDDGIELSDDDALVLIKTSVIMEFEVISDFTVNNKEAFVIGFIEDSTDS